MTPGRVEHVASVVTYRDQKGAEWAMWKCSCGDWLSGYLKRRYAEDDARFHEAESTPTARREAGE